MAGVVFNDRPLIGVRTGVGHYLAEVLSHWPREEVTIPVGGIGRWTRSRYPRLPEPFRFGSLDQIDPVKMTTLDRLAGEHAEACGRGGAAGAFRPVLQAGLECVQRVSALDAGLFWEPNHIPAARGRRVVTTVHDLSVLDRPGDHPAHRVEHWRRAFEARLDWSDAFVCVSRATADALGPHLATRGLDPASARVIHLGPRWPEAPADWTPSGVRSRLGLGEGDRLIVCLGTIEPRKNHRVLLDALGEMSESERGGLKLVFAGRPGWGGSAFWASLAEHPMAASVIAPGYVDDAQAAALLLASRGLVYPSLYEGFGLPLLEAMRLGAPTGISSAASLVEVAGGSSLVAAPDDAAAWAGILATLAGDEAERARLADLGRARAGAFSWARCAAEHAALFKELLP
ncbi:MAG: glycosyltransferase family 4 protein [Phycisphaeraceae bacterium]|nr:MAG: glycosyltransferase family 4 protein [Phycisphaeraceae bacterium]